MTALTLAGLLAYYAPGYDWGAIAQRHNLVLPASHVGIAATCDLLGWEGTLYVGAQTWPVVIVDCVAAEDEADVRARGIVGEVPFEVASRVEGFIDAGLWPGRLELYPPGCDEERRWV